LRVWCSQGEVYTVEGELELPHMDADEAYEVLRDYEGASAVFRNIVSTEVERVSPSLARLRQTCEWRFLVFRGKFMTALTAAEASEKRRLVCTMAADGAASGGGFLKQFEARWEVHEREGGGCRVRHRLTIQMAMAMPAGFAGSYTMRIFQKQVKALLSDLSAFSQTLCVERGGEPLACAREAEEAASAVVALAAAAEPSAMFLEGREEEEAAAEAEDTAAFEFAQGGTGTATVEEVEVEEGARAEVVEEIPSLWL